ncbi:MAG: hypothetical protein L0H55_07695 [Candidatus Nitrosocosmicus sp.]|nr:hypothetical protein [Candidatus Nitrosocosmicus sp.]
MKKIETRTRIDQKHHKEFINDINNSENNRDTDAHYYVSIDIGKRNCVACITDKDGNDELYQRKLKRIQG